MVTTSGERGSSAFLTLEGLAKTFGSNKAVDDVSLSIPEGEFFTIVGPSGSGKSTLIRILAGLETPSAGRVLLRGADITAMPANRRPTCMVFQSLALFNHMSVGDNIGFALKMRGINVTERRHRALELLDLVRLPQDFLDKPVTQCSGGEKQRVALARALASDPEILFFDEPLSAIDYRLRKILEVEMKDLHRRTGKTFIYITHSLEEAMVMSDRIAIMRDGAIIQIGAPEEIYARPASRFVAEFMGEVNVLPVSGGEVAGQPAAGIADGWLIVRPEALRPLAADAPADISFDARVQNDYMLGSRTQFHLAALDQTLVAELPAGLAADVDPGDSGRWGFDLGDCIGVKE